MMQIGIRAHDMPDADFESRVTSIRAMNFQCTQLILHKTIHDFNVAPSALTPGMAMYMQRVLSRNCIDLAVLGCYYNLATPDLNELNNTYRTYQAHIRFANFLGCAIVGTETGAVNKEYQYDESNHSEEALQLFIQRLRPIVVYAEKMGVIIGIEPVNNHIVSTVERARQVLDTIASPNLGIIFDPVNLLSNNNYTNQEELIDYAFSVLRNEIMVIHIKDFSLVNDQIVSVPIGTGEFAFKKLITNIHSYKPFIHAILEDTKPDNVKCAKDFICSMYNTIKA